MLQALVPRNQRGLISKAHGACKVHGVVTAKAVLGREVARSTSEGVINTDYPLRSRGALRIQSSPSGAQAL
ncbi:MAG TPA: hypothetical protein VG165_05175 [Solirubrobacteraceae bacterium]|nr:hypothetical protein [Solirubrobacteraceae bacterium]